MEVKIGVQHSPRELVIDSPKTPDEIAADVAAAMAGSTKDGLLTLVDDRGRRVLVPVDRIAYVEIAQSDQRRVGFIARRRADSLIRHGTVPTGRRPHTADGAPRRLGAHRSRIGR